MATNSELRTINSGQSGTHFLIWADVDLLRFWLREHKREGYPTMKSQHLLHNSVIIYSAGSAERKWSFCNLYNSYMLNSEHQALATTRETFGYFPDQRDGTQTNDCMYWSCFSSLEVYQVENEILCRTYKKRLDPLFH